ncbi:NADH dehydrogenase (ubiquinone) 24 kDa subunit [Thermodesulfobium narugense DSM 14796]|uniref:NADH dehydrogenase (Ubiquinone) 24 kDa subunit n=1 Tax=Thermodesulfobium narugense DSM 14796 TaxID=747365 RepID=M1E7J1_9BACT|nr:NAD(P)H-dependent oxidoreductase subunit E [Thermodesulfobium narugense]AEE14668.1 NADH dehydrogenase (ubiquinone) 24 kDa subunit [Thermodesulfobium narugense DSM 14796]
MEITNFPAVDREIKKWGLRSESLIQILHGTQESIGYLPEEILSYIAEKLNISLSKIYGVVTFYNFFKLTKDAEHVITTCLGTACYVKGGEKILNALCNKLNIKPNEITKDNKFTVKTVRCVGCCGFAPVMIIDGKDIYGKLSENEAIEILERYMIP